MVAFVTPLAALAAFAALLPLGAWLLAERRAERVRLALGLSGPSLRQRLPAVLAVILVFALLGAAAAQPVARFDEEISARTDAEVFFVFDVSRSMLAATAPGAPTRFERAVRLAGELRTSIGGVPVGVASLTDRPLPHLFPSSDPRVFAALVERALGIERPPPSEPGRTRATDFGSLTALGKANFFSARSVRRLVVLLTDGESRPFDEEVVARALGAEGVVLLAVRFWGAGERVYDEAGRPEPGYRPDPGSGEALAGLAARTSGGVFPEHEGAAIGARVRAVLGDGPTVTVGASEHAVPLAAYLALAAGVPLAFLLSRGIGLPASRPAPGPWARRGPVRS